MRKNTNSCEITFLGQGGFRLGFESGTVFIDPYLSDSVEKRLDQRMKRRFPPPIDPRAINDACAVFITHSHQDHCDPDTLLPIHLGSPECRFIGPQPVLEKLMGWGIPQANVHAASNELELSGFSVSTVPAAHPTVMASSDQSYDAVGYIIRTGESKFYFSGDTIFDEYVLEQVESRSPIDYSFIPVNERNYERERDGILGNMSVRDAYYFAEKIGTKTLIPCHWDMFDMNRVFPEEMRVVFENGIYSFKLSILHHGDSLIAC